MESFLFFTMVKNPSLPPINRKALIAFLFSIIAILAFCVGLFPIPFTALLCYPPGILLGIASFILGAQALRPIRENGERGRPLALIAMWVSVLLTLATLCMIISGILLWPYVSEFIQQTWDQLFH
jgi:hypothetical protein